MTASPSARLRAAAVLPLFAWAIPACEQEPLAPPGQLVVYVDTDAPLVTTLERDFDPTTRAGLFDTLRVEVLDDSGPVACDTCTRDFVVTQDDLDGDHLSFGVQLPPGKAGGRLRLRLFPSDARVGEEPRVDAAIDGLFALPPRPEEGRVELSVVLAFENLGADVDLSSPGADPVRGRAARVTPFVPRARATCAGEPRTGEVCVPGGVFWANAAYGELAVLEPWRAIVMSPFYLDAHEVTVAELRAAGVAKAGDPRVSVECTYAAKPGPNDDRPVTCIRLETARAYCQARGGDLPTLSQLEYVRGRLIGAPHVWGFDPPGCEDAVWARSAMCAALGPGPLRAGSAARDRLVLPGGEITDLMANVAELLADRTSRECRAHGVYVDPTCGPAGGVTSGSYASTSHAALAAPLRSPDLAAPHEEVGFRCARPNER